MRFSIDKHHFIVIIVFSFVLTIQPFGETPSKVPAPNSIQVAMYRLNSNGSIYEATPGVRASCATPDHQNRWGCTAFHVDQRTATPVLYPYGSTPAPEVAFETDYLKNVVPQEMRGGAPQIALQAQAVAARSYAMYQVTQTPVSPRPFNNSAENQVFVPYRFELLRVEGGDPGHNPTTTPTPNVNNCTTLPDSGVTRYQRNVCEA